MKHLRNQSHNNNARPICCLTEYIEIKNVKPKLLETPMEGFIYKKE